MGTFSYICKCCGKPINAEPGISGEKCVLKHIRYSKLIGSATGEYDGYGGVIGDKTYNCHKNTANPNSAEEIYTSMYELYDSVFRPNIPRLYDGEYLLKWQFARTMIELELHKKDFMLQECEFYEYLSEDSLKKVEDKLNDFNTKNTDSNTDVMVALDAYSDLITVIYEETVLATDYGKKITAEFEKLPEPAKSDTFSGVAAWHYKCYEDASPEEKTDLTPSAYDVNQGMGELQEEYL